MEKAESVDDIFKLWQGEDVPGNLEGTEIKNFDEMKMPAYLQKIIRVMVMNEQV